MYVHMQNTNLLHMNFLHPILPNNFAGIFISITDIGHEKNFGKSTLKIIQKHIDNNLFHIL